MSVVAIVLNSSWNVLNFRKGVVKALISRGVTVHVIAPHDDSVKALIDLGCRCHHISIRSASLNPLIDMKYCVDLFAKLRVLNPDFVLAFTAKPNIYGGVVARLAKIGIVNNIAGLGIGFSRAGPLRSLLLVMYRFALKRSLRVFFQNSSDRQGFIASGVVDVNRTDVLPGSGIDLVEFPQFPVPSKTGGVFRFLFVGRLLKSKGVLLLAEAGRILEREFPGAIRIDLIGSTVPESSDRLDASDLERLGAEPIRVHGHVGSVIDWIRECHCLVLPSFYPEGTPRSILEALAVGRPVITTNTPGCQDTVTEANGILVAEKSLDELVNAMRRILQLSSSELERMGSASRKHCEAHYSDIRVINAYLRELNLVEVDQAGIDSVDRSRSSSAPLLSTQERS